MSKILCWRWRTQREPPISYSNASSEVPGNYITRDHMVPRCSYNISEGEVVNLQSEAIIQVEQVNKFKFGEMLQGIGFNESKV